MAGDPYEPVCVMVSNDMPYASRRRLQLARSHRPIGHRFSSAARGEADVKSMVRRGPLVTPSRHERVRMSGLGDGSPFKERTPIQRGRWLSG